MRSQLPENSLSFAVCRITVRALFGLMFMVLATPAYSQSDSDTQFVIGPAPVAKALLPGENTNRFELGYINLSFINEDVSSDDSETEFDIFGGAWTQRGRSGDNWRLGYRRTIFGSYGSSVGELDLELLNTSLVTDGELYLNRTGSFILFGGFQFGFGTTSVTFCFQQTCQTSETNTFSGGARLGVQKRFPIGLGFGITPYAMISSIRSEAVPVDEGETIGFTVTTSVVGLDFDFRNISLTAFYQGSDDFEIVTLSLGFNF